MKIIIPGIPQAKMRHRLSNRGGFARMYDPQEKEKRKLKSELAAALLKIKLDKNQEIAMEASNLTNSEFFFLDVCFYVPYPKSVAKGKRNAMLWGLIRPNLKPDLDNLLKFLCDAANGILFADDCKIVESSQKEYFSDKPRTEIVIMAKKQMDVNESTKKILSTISPDQIAAMIEITENLRNEFLQNPNPSPKNCEIIAAFISQIADNFADELKKISKLCPLYWKEKL